MRLQHALHASEEGAQSTLIRRALIRAMARPGPVLTERFGAAPAVVERWYAARFGGAELSPEVLADLARLVRASRRWTPEA